MIYEYRVTGPRCRSTGFDDSARADSERLWRDKAHGGLCGPHVVERREVAAWEPIPDSLFGGEAA